MYSTKVIKVTNADATTGANAGPAVHVGNAKRIGILVRVGSHTSGNTVFSFKAGMEELDGSNAPTMTAFNMVLDNAANTNAQMPIRVASKTLSANGDALLWVDPMCKINFLEVDYNTTTDGKASVFLILEEET